MICTIALPCWHYPATLIALLTISSHLTCAIDPIYLPYLQYCHYFATLLAPLTLSSYTICIADAIWPPYLHYCTYLGTLFALLTLSSRLVCTIGIIWLPYLHTDSISSYTICAIDNICALLALSGHLLWAHPTYIIRSIQSTLSLRHQKLKKNNALLEKNNPMPSFVDIMEVCKYTYIYI